VRRPLLAATVGLALLVVSSAPARFALATDGPELLAEAEAAELHAEPARALELYRRFEASHRGERLARRAEARSAWLEARREGDFGPLAELLAMRARVSVEPRPDDLRGFAAKVARFPEGRVRRESYELLGDTWLSRLDAPSEALVSYLAWSRERGIDEAERQLAAAGIALARARLGDAGEALGELERSGLRERSESRYLRAERVRAAAVSASRVVLFAYALTLIKTLVGSRRRLVWRPRVSGVELGLAVFTLGLPVAFVERFDSQLVHTFAPVMAAMAAVLASTWLVASLASPTDAERKPLAASSAVGVIAAGLLACAQSGMLTELLMAAWEPR
jgi:hypothetical protein